jgi:uncharacterized protein
LKGNSARPQKVKLAVQDCYKRLLGFAMEGEARIALKKRADEEAIRVFADTSVNSFSPPPSAKRTLSPSIRGSARDAK